MPSRLHLSKDVSLQVAWFGFTSRNCAGPRTCFLFIRDGRWVVVGGGDFSFRWAHYLVWRQCGLCESVGVVRSRRCCCSEERCFPSWVSSTCTRSDIRSWPTITNISRASVSWWDCAQLSPCCCNDADGGGAFP